MRKLLLAAMLAVASCTAPAYAQPTCVPLPAIAVELKALGVTKEQVFTTTDVSFISIYNASAGLTLPDDIAPVGMILIATDTVAVAALVEAGPMGLCVRYTQRLDVGVHKRAFAAAKVVA